MQHVKLLTEASQEKQTADRSIGAELDNIIRLEKLTVQTKQIPAYHAADAEAGRTGEEGAGEKSEVAAEECGFRIGLRRRCCGAKNSRPGKTGRTQVLEQI